MQAEPSPPTYKITDILKSDPKKLSTGEIKNIYCVPMQASSSFINVAYITNYYCSKLMSFTSDGHILHHYIFQSGNVKIVVLNSKIVLMYSVIKYNGDCDDWIAVWDPFTDYSKQIRHGSYYDQDQISSIQLLAFQDTSLFCICQIQHNQSAQPQYCIIMYYNINDFILQKQQSTNKDFKNVPSCIHKFKYVYSDEQKKNRCYPINVERQGKIMFVSTRPIVVNGVKQTNQNDIRKDQCLDEMGKLDLGGKGEDIGQGAVATVEIGYYFYKLNKQQVKNCSVYKFRTKQKSIQIIKVWQQREQTLIIWKQCEKNQNPHYCTYNHKTKHYHELHDLSQQSLDNIILSIQYHGHVQQPTKYNIKSHTFQTAYWDYASNNTRSNTLKVIVRYQFGTQYACNAVYLSKPTGNNKSDSIGRFQVRYTDKIIVMYCFVGKDIIMQAVVIPELIYQANEYAVYLLVQSIGDCDEDLLAAVFDLV